MWTFQTLDGSAQVRQYVLGEAELVKQPCTVASNRSRAELQKKRWLELDHPSAPRAAALDPGFFTPTQMRYTRWSLLEQSYLHGPVYLDSSYALIAQAIDAQGNVRGHSEEVIAILVPHENVRIALGNGGRVVLAEGEYAFQKCAEDRVLVHKIPELMCEAEVQLGPAPCNPSNRKFVSAQRKLRRCDVCGQIWNRSMKNCAACLRGSYCSKVCRRADWPFHREWCSTRNPGKLFEIVDGGHKVGLKIRVRDQTGEEEWYKLMPTSPLVKVFDAFAREKGVDASSLRFVFHGQRVRGDRTPQDIGMEHGDMLDCMHEQVAEPFGDHAGSPGLSFLQPGAKLHATAAVVREIAARCRGGGGSEGAAPYFRSDPVAGLGNAAQRAALRSRLDRGAAVDGELDFNELLTRREASSRLGAKFCASLEALFAAHGGRVDAVALRRSAAVGQCIRFHADENFMTLQVCLNDDFDGGDLVYLADDCALVKPRRPAGSYTVHNDRVVHGVSTLVRGVRYALLLLMRQP